MPRSARGLRACRRDDLTAVAALYELVMRSGRREAATAGLARYFERTFFDCPWADEELAPLVYEDEGGHIVGFLGQHVRRVRLDGRLLRLCCGGPLEVDPTRGREPAPSAPSSSAATCSGRRTPPSPTAPTIPCGGCGSSAAARARR
jgi:hypothetical protein